MIVQRFVKWCETANSRQRAEGVLILARALAQDRVPAEETANAVAALTLVLDDPSPKVRRALAATLACSPRTPRQIALALAEDADEIACLVVGHSPVLTDCDLIDLAAIGTSAVQSAIAGRRPVSMKLAAALAEVADPAALHVLLSNDHATMAARSHRRIAERHGEDAALRSAMFERRDLPADVRQTLVLHLGRALAGSDFVARAMGAERAQRVALDACERATALVAESTPADETAALVDHLRASGQLTTAFLIRIVCAGHIDLFAAAMVALSGRSEARVRSIIVDGREAAFHALVTAAGLPKASAPLLRAAVQAWRETAAGSAARNPVDGAKADGAATVMERLVAAFRERGRGAEANAVSALLNRLSAETLLGAARDDARRMAAAA